MKYMDPSIELVLCGSSSSGMPTYAQWEATVLEHCYENVDYLSLHNYYADHDNDSATFLASNMEMDWFISQVVSICDYIKAKKRSKKTMYLSFDEWNVWFHSNEQDAQIPWWVEAPHQLEDVYDFRDAMLVGSLMITLLRHCDRVKIACLAQLVNVIAPIMTSDTSAWRQTTFFPFCYTSRYGHGTVLQTLVDCPTYENKRHGTVPYVDSVCIYNEEQDELVVFAVNKDLEEDFSVTMELRQFADYHIAEHVVLHDEDLFAVNSEANPNRVVPFASTESNVENGILTANLKHKSWNMIRLCK